MTPTSRAPPPSLQEWLPDVLSGYFLSDLVEALNLTPILQTYGGVTRGTAPYHPQLLVKILFYAYAVGIPASRQIAKELDENVAFRVLAANQRRELSDDQRLSPQHLTALADLFVEVLTLCRGPGWSRWAHRVGRHQDSSQCLEHKAMSYGRMEEGGRSSASRRCSSRRKAVDVERRRHDGADGAATNCAELAGAGSSGCRRSCRQGCVGGGGAGGGGPS